MISIHEEMMDLKRHIMRFINLWPPFLFAGISVAKLSPDYRQATIKLRLCFWNKNYVGTQYGGSMFSMADPFYMIMLIENLGKEYQVWDKAATIRYIKPGRSELTAEFHLSDNDLAAIRQGVAEKGRVEWVRTVEIKDTSGDVVALVEKVISIKTRITGSQDNGSKRHIA